VPWRSKHPLLTGHTRREPFFILDKLNEVQSRSSQERFSLVDVFLLDTKTESLDFPSLLVVINTIQYSKSNSFTGDLNQTNQVY
jgi:hypothetical protein